MKYEDQVFNLSADAYTRTELSDNTENDEILKKQAKLLKILLKKIQEELKAKGNVNQGILKVKFNSKFWQNSELGYREIEELALLFASDNPDFDKLVTIIDQMLKLKKDKLLGISGQKS